MRRPSGATVQRWMLWFNGVSTVAWALLIAPTVLFWPDSILWIALMSVWANFAAALSGLVGAMAAREANDDVDT